MLGVAPVACATKYPQADGHNPCRPLEVHLTTSPREPVPNPCKPLRWSGSVLWQLHNLEGSGCLQGHHGQDRRGYTHCLCAKITLGVVCHLALQDTALPSRPAKVSRELPQLITTRCETLGDCPNLP